MFTPTQAALARRALDARFDAIRPNIGQRPPAGWIRAIRDALGMTGSDLAGRMGITQSRVTQIEKAEQNGELKLSTLARAADALGCELVYALVPRSGSLEADVRAQARSRATEEARRVAHTMRLEAQSADDELDAVVDELTADLVGSPRLWR